MTRELDTAPQFLALRGTLTGLFKNSNQNEGTRSAVTKPSASVVKLGGDAGGDFEAVGCA
jgi:hypothetical protein